MTLRAHGGRLHHETAGAPGEIEFEIDNLRRVIGIRLGAHPNEAIAQAPSQRAEALPFQAIERVTGGVGLRYRRAAQFLPPIVVVALRAGQVQLALPALENLSAGIAEPAGLRIVRDGDRQSLRLMRNKRRQRTLA